jgi:hypothetical protein
MDEPPARNIRCGAAGDEDGDVFNAIGQMSREQVRALA